jgi:purine/pyrimidine-nucleoside phosphorylase
MNKMSEFTNVTISTKANIYFEGKVTSRTVVFEDGTRKTLGIMLPGEYEFSTSQKEEMDIQAGVLDYKLSGQEWKTIENQGVFYVPANESFQLKVHSVVDYCCSYLSEEN